MGLIGLDLLGLAHPKWDLGPTIRAIQEYGNDISIGVFDTTFGDVLPKLNKLIAQCSNIKAIRVHLWWDDNHKIVPPDVIKKRAPKYETWAKIQSHITFYLSHSCECDSTNVSEINKRIDLIHKQAPTCIAVHSRGAHGVYVSGVINEDHSLSAKILNPSIASTDGNNSYDVDWRSYMGRHLDANLLFAWGYRFNLRQITEPGVKPLPIKLRTAAPDYNYMKSMTALLRNFIVPITPADPKAKAILPPFIYKSHSEDKQGSSDTRALKPCLIVPGAKRNVSILTDKGTKIGELAYYGSYQGALNRYYSGLPKDGGINLYGWQIAEKARKVSGWDVVYFDDGKTVFGPVYPSLRAGSFRG